MQYLAYTAGKMVVHMGIVPGGDQEKFVVQRLRALRGQNSHDVIVMHLPESMHDNRIVCTYWPSGEGLWDHSVLKKILALQPRLVIVPRLSMPELHEAEQAQYLENLAAIMQQGGTVETSLSILEVARVDDMLSPQVSWPKHAAMTGDYLRKHVSDYLVHDMQPQAIMARFYGGDIEVHEILKGREQDLFNIGNLNRLREMMLRFVNAHMTDVARRTNPERVDLPVNASVSVQDFLVQTLYATSANMAVIAAAHLLWKFGGLPFYAGWFFMLAGPVVTALFVNPFTTFLAVMATFVSFNVLFMPMHFPESLLDPEQGPLILTFLLVILGVSYIANRVYVRQQKNQEQTVLLRALLRLTYDLSNADTVDEAVESGINNLQRTLNLPAVVVEPDGRVWAANGSEVILGQEDIEAARKAMMNGNIVAPDKKLDWMWCPLNLRRTVMGAIGVKVPAEKVGAPTWGTMNMLRAYSDMMAVGLRRMQLREASDNASQEAEREGLRTALLSAVSHDLKTPLVSIIGSLSTLRKVGDKLPKADRMELLQTASEEAERLHSIIHNVLELTRLESGQIKPKLVAVDLEAVLDSLKERCQRYYPKLKVVIRGKGGIPWVEADPLLLEEVLFNIFDNAAKYAGFRHPLEVSAEERGDVVRVEIADRGPGVPEAERGKVFDKYYRAEKKDSAPAGSGLGLAISRAIVEACHGKIWVEARADGKEGTVMVLELVHADIPSTEEEKDDE